MARLVALRASSPSGAVRVGAAITAVEATRHTLLSFERTVAYLTVTLALEAYREGSTCYTGAIIAVVARVGGGHTAAIAHPVGSAPLAAAIFHTVVRWVGVTSTTIVYHRIATPNAIAVLAPLAAKIQNSSSSHIYPVTPPWL